MRVAIGADHGGFPIKQAVIDAVREAGQEPIDMGAFSLDNGDDYPDYAEPVCSAIQEGRAERGILICGSGIGVCIVANKMRGIYASVVQDLYSAAQGVEHDNMNVLCLGGRLIDAETARKLVLAFLAANFSSEERHRRRVGKTQAIEAREFQVE